MEVEKLKYTIWAADTNRAVAFYQNVFQAQIIKQNQHITELDVAGGVISIHGGGEGNKTWTGLTFQVADVEVGADMIVEAGGQCPKAPQPEDGEPPHLAMCMDTENNQIMLTRQRS